MAPHFRAILGLLLFSTAAYAGDAGLLRQVDAYRAANEPQIIGELDELTRIRSIAADRAGLAAAADRLLGALRQRGFDARPQWEAGYPAFRSDMSTPAARAVVSAASFAAGAPVAVLPMMGGSVPIYLFADIFEVPVIGLPIVNYDDNQHAANENLRLQNLWDGIRTYAAMMGTLTW